MVIHVEQMPFDWGMSIIVYHTLCNISIFDNSDKQTILRSIAYLVFTVMFVLRKVDNDPQFFVTFTSRFFLLFYPSKNSMKKQSWAQS